MDNDEVVQSAEEAGLSLIRFLYCDTNSIIRGKNVPIGRLRQRMVDGVGLSRALLAADLDGLNRGLDPGPPTGVDPDTLSEEQSAEMGIERLPKTLTEALEAFEADPVIASALDPLLKRSYAAIKRSEIAAYALGDEESLRDEAEFAGHFYKY